MRRFSFVFFCSAFSLLSLLSSCLQTPASPASFAPTVTYHPFVTLSPTLFGPPWAPLPSPSLFRPTVQSASSSPAVGARTHYRMQVLLDYVNRSLVVDEYITYVNTTGVPLENLVLAVEPNRQEGVFKLETVAAPSVSGYALNGSRLEVRLRPALPAGESLELYLRFTLNLPPADIFNLFGYRSGQMNLVDWYPFIVPYRVGWVLHEKGEVGEHLVYETADFDVSILPTEAQTSVLIAAPVAPDRNVYRLQGARTFAFSVSDRWKMASRTVGATTLTSYFLPADEVQGQRVLDEAALALETFAHLFGPYPYPALTIVQAEFADGMEYDGLFYLGRRFYLEDDGTKLNYLIALTVHETAHQWWRGLVGNDSALEPWLDEALATYSEYLFYEQNYPGVAEAWWALRVENFAPQGFVDARIYDMDDKQMYTNAVYLRGALFLRDLRARLGDEAFFAFLREYAAQMSGKIASDEDFFRILASHTQVDLSDLLQKYFRPGHP
ncbi:MAG: M1 family metallopeptidase [Anaerolineales bacterium]|nr:M1 family metallopeptidase [Anaerolineales bacterium]MDW8228168.1 M1 family metallopeptidase [Anaerolineales bacterium]